MRGRLRLRTIDRQTNRLQTNRLQTNRLQTNRLQTNRLQTKTVGETENFSPTPPLTFFCILMTPCLRILLLYRTLFSAPSFQTPQPCLNRSHFEAENKRPPR
uniref:Uncharacterized protein n=1 Tax=Magnetococcus massalia (strain MO-1) TaxID=451514 RepID=A0A1S7LHK4_MAGMO|nr:protein of unknown function [Candidatus Magnetococcus massalia]